MAVSGLSGIICLGGVIFGKAYSVSIKINKSKEKNVVRM